MKEKREQEISKMRQQIEDRLAEAVAPEGRSCAAAGVSKSRVRGQSLVATKKAVEVYPRSRRSKRWKRH